MSNRKCIYTNKEANGRDRVVPKSKVGNEIHNWCNYAPVNNRYKDIKKGKMPDELELQANELFRMIELHKIRVRYYEEQLEEIQNELKKRLKPDKGEVKKEREIKQAFIEKAVLEEHEEEIDKILDKRKKKVLWE